MDNKAKSPFMLVFMMSLGFIWLTAGPLIHTANAAGETPTIMLDNQCTIEGGCGEAGLAGNVTIGWSFSTQSDIRVTALGIFDDYFFSGQDPNKLGLKEPHQVGIWDSSGNLIVSATIPSGTNTTAIGAFRYVPIIQTILPANNTFRIGAFYGGPQDLYVRYIQGTGFTVDPSIQLLMSGNASGFSAPILNSPYQSYIPFGPSFLIDQSVNLACQGFGPPLESGPVIVKKNKALPLKAMLLDGSTPVTNLDIVAPPVIQVLYNSGIGGDAIDVTDYALQAGQGTEGNQFEFDGTWWHFNLGIKNYIAPGTYTVSMISGDATIYMVAPTCTAQFVVKQ